MTDCQKSKREKRLPFIGLVLCSLIFVFSSLVGLRILFFTPSAPVEPAFALSVEPTAFDFGVVSKELHSTMFTLKNISEQPISLLYAVASCSCTSISFRETLILPQKTTVMTYNLDATVMSDPFHGSVVIGYVLKDVSSIDSEIIVEPIHTIVSVQATVLSENEQFDSVY